MPNAGYVGEGGSLILSLEVRREGIEYICFSLYSKVSLKRLPATPMLGFLSRGRPESWGMIRSPAPVTEIVGTALALSLAVADVASRAARHSAALLVYAQLPGERGASVGPRVAPVEAALLRSAPPMGSARVPGASVAPDSECVFCRLWVP